MYRALARWTDRHGPLGPDQVDGMDISVVAMLMGVDAGTSFDAIAAEWREEYQREMERFEEERQAAIPSA